MDQEHPTGTCSLTNWHVAVDEDDNEDGKKLPAAVPSLTSTSTSSSSSWTTTVEWGEGEKDDDDPPTKGKEPEVTATAEWAEGEKDDDDPPTNEKEPEVTAILDTLKKEFGVLVVNDANENDVVSGRGGESLKRNAKYRGHVNANRQDWRLATNNAAERNEIARRIYQLVVEGSPPGRFLESVQAWVDAAQRKNDKAATATAAADNTAASLPLPSLLPSSPSVSQWLQQVREKEERELPLFKTLIELDPHTEWWRVVDEDRALQRIKAAFKEKRSSSLKPPPPPPPLLPSGERQPSLTAHGVPLQVMSPDPEKDFIMGPEGNANPANRGFRKTVRDSIEHYKSRTYKDKRPCIENLIQAFKEHGRFLKRRTPPNEGTNVPRNDAKAAWMVAPDDDVYDMVQKMLLRPTSNGNKAPNTSSAARDGSASSFDSLEALLSESAAELSLRCPQKRPVPAHHSRDDTRGPDDDKDESTTRRSQARRLIESGTSFGDSVNETESSFDFRIREREAMGDGELIINRNDVMCYGGIRRGASVYDGNKQLFALLVKYKQASVGDVVKLIRQMDPPGRFLNKQADGTWVDIGDKCAVRRVLNVIESIELLCQPERSSYQSDGDSAATSFPPFQVSAHLSRRIYWFVCATNHPADGSTGEWGETFGQRHFIEEGIASLASGFSCMSISTASRSTASRRTEDNSIMSLSSSGSLLRAGAAGPKNR